MEWFKELYTRDFMDLCGFASPEQTAAEAQFVVDILRLNQNSKLLDLCCGFGRYAYEIARRTSCHVVGYDLSADFISMAKENYMTPKIEYVTGDMRHIDLDMSFDAVINLFTSFGFFDTDEENEGVLREVNKVLKKDGLFLLDYENKFYFVLHDVLKKGRIRHNMDNEKYCVIENRYDVMTEREIFSASIFEKTKKVKAVGYHIRLYSLPELQQMLKRSGFEITRIWGDFDKSDYSVHSRRLITLSRKNKEV